MTIVLSSDARGAEEWAVRPTLAGHTNSAAAEGPAKRGPPVGYKDLKLVNPIVLRVHLWSRSHLPIGVLRIEVYRPLDPSQEGVIATVPILRCIVTDDNYLLS